VDPALTGDTRNDLPDMVDIFCVEPLPQFTPLCRSPPAQPPAVLQPMAALSALAHSATRRHSYAGDRCAPRTRQRGTASSFISTAHFFLMQLRRASSIRVRFWWARFYSGAITAFRGAG